MAALRANVFTEYGDTLKYLLRMLTAAIEGTQDAERRLLKFHGGMSDETRDEVQRAFNAPPDEHPVRILLATDAKGLRRSLAARRGRSRGRPPLHPRPASRSARSSRTAATWRAA